MRIRLRLMTATAASCAGLAGTVIAEEPIHSTPPVVSTVALTALPDRIVPVSTVRPSSIPEPVSLAVFGTGILLLLRRRRS